MKYVFIIGLLLAILVTNIVGFNLFTKKFDTFVVSKQGQAELSIQETSPNKSLQEQEVSPIPIVKLMPSQQRQCRGYFQ